MLIWHQLTLGLSHSHTWHPARMDEQAVQTLMYLQSRFNLRSESFDLRSSALTSCSYSQHASPWARVSMVNGWTRDWWLSIIPLPITTGAAYHTDCSEEYVAYVLGSSTPRARSYCRSTDRMYGALDLFRNRSLACCIAAELDRDRALLGPAFRLRLAILLSPNTLLWRFGGSSADCLIGELFWQSFNRFIIFSRFNSSRELALMGSILGSKSGCVTLASASSS